MVWLISLVLTASAADFREVAKAATPSVATLRVDLDAGGVAFASGFVIDDGTVLVTNFHVIEGATKIVATFEDGDSLVSTGVIATDPDIDLALLRLMDAHPVLAMGSLPEVGTPVLAAGNPQNLGLSFTDGMLSGVHERDGYRVLQHSAPISPGNSGGPLMDASGAVIGVNSFHLANIYGQNVNFAVSADHVAALVEQARATIDGGGSTPLAVGAGEKVDTRSSALVRRGPPQVACSAPTDPPWPFDTPVKLSDMAEVAPPVVGGVCRHHQVAGVDFFFARFEEPEFADGQLDDEAVRLGYLARGRDGCSARFERALKPSDRPIEMVATRHRDHLLLYARIAPGAGSLTDRVKQMYCRELDKLRVAARF